ncbi:hypothetical protein AVEN_146589-1 [Araneus ventricosus]|uniref:Uncharacterized protein n=1 Tax=Araneus ventricosus TaxID=182803 RepID=A0A4Y2GC43_ARAVE|nr:hypothetical protein AVEN_146589-1 [Araneus ventricosus]
MVPVTFQNFVEQLDKSPHHLLPLNSFKMGIHCRSVPHHLERVSPDSSSFQPINLAGSFMEAPCERHNRRFQSPPRANCALSSLFQNGTPHPSFLERASLLSHFVVLAFVRG